MTHLNNIIIRLAKTEDMQYASIISEALATSAFKRGVAIKQRPAEYIIEKMLNNLAIIAIDTESGEWVGFCCLEVWKHQKFVANSGLIVAEKYRGCGLLKVLKRELFHLCSRRFPEAKIFSISSNPSVIKFNTELGFEVVNSAAMLCDKLFTTGCNSWVNFTELMTQENSHHIAMVYTPKALPVPLTQMATSLMK